MLSIAYLNALYRFFLKITKYSLGLLGFMLIFAASCMLFFWMPFLIFWVLKSGFMDNLISNTQ